MKCDFCNNEILPGKELQYNGYYFCNTLHRYSWINQNNKTNGGIIPKKKDLLQKNQKARNNIKIYIAIFAVVFASIGSIIGSKVVNELQNNSIDSEMIRFSSEINKNCPIMVDKETRLDNTIAISNSEITYNYTLINFLANQINAPEFESTLRPRITNVIKTNEQMKYLRDKLVSFIYNYKDKTGVSVTTIKITPEDYNK